MSAVTDAGAEREIDLGRWKQAAVERWWLVAAGLVAGAIVGALYSLSGGSIWQASVLIAPGQPFSPQGSPVLSYTSSPRGIEQVVTSEAALKRAAGAAGVGVGSLRGHVSTQTVSTGASTSTASRGATLIRITVQLHKPKHAEDAANALGRIVINDTSPYVKQSLAAYATQIASFETQLGQLQKRINVLNDVLNRSGLTDIEKLIVAGQADNAQTRFGTISDNLSLVRQQQSSRRSSSRRPRSRRRRAPGATRSSSAR
jgi:hypothetical protein